MKFFKNVNGYNVLDCAEAEFYIPMSYFGESLSSFAEDRGRYIHTLGVFVIQFFDASHKSLGYKLLNVPNKIDLLVYDSEIRSVILPHTKKKHDSELKCRVLKYVKGMKVMNENLIKDSSNAEDFISIVTKGAIPDSTPYDKAMDIWDSNIDINSVNLGVQDVIRELILSVSYRWKDDPTKTFAEALAEHPELSMYDYIMNNIRQICQNTSTYMGITYEDIDSMVISSVNRKIQKKGEPYSPVEVLLKL